MKENETVKIGGFPAKAIVIPLAVTIAILHIAIVSLVFDTNHSNRELSEMMQNCSDYQQYATNLQASCSTLSETASAFAQTPVATDGEFNAGPLLRYVQELGRDRRGPKMAEWFKTQNASEEVQSCIDAAAIESEKMYETQLHVIALLCSIYPKPPIPELSAIPDVSLTEEELAMTEENREAYAKGLIINKDYSTLKASVADNVENCHRILQEEYSRAFAQSQRHINEVRIWLWIVIILIILIMLGTFILFYRWLIMPLRSYAKQITSDQNMDQDQAGRLREMRLVISSYNALLRRHDKLESILRSAAETDALTELPNRYCLQRDALEIGDDHGAMAVIMFDVNYLKRTNDTGGHVAGDRLLCTVAACIRECFRTDDNGRCYRIGGDEFAAILRKCSEEEVRSRIDRFSLATERENISVSVGYAYMEKTNENSLDTLMKEADEHMYTQKKIFHDIESSSDRS